jgi:hypothetical protein
MAEQEFNRRRTDRGEEEASFEQGVTGAALRESNGRYREGDSHVFAETANAVKKVLGHGKKNEEKFSDPSTVGTKTLFEALHGSFSVTLEVLKILIRKLTNNDAYQLPQELKDESYLFTGLHVRGGGKIEININDKGDKLVIRARKIWMSGGRVAYSLSMKSKDPIFQRRLEALGPLEEEG